MLNRPRNDKNGSKISARPALAAINGQLKEVNDWLRVRKLEMPMFNGDSPNGQLYRSERYFEVSGLTKK